MITGDLTTFGGDGDDTWFVEDYGAVDANANTDEKAWGGAGNDVVRGTHKFTEGQSLIGGDGHDKVYGGDGGGSTASNLQLLAGNDGDDWLEAGDNHTGDIVMYGDSAFENFVIGSDGYGNGSTSSNKEAGDDVLYGGDGTAGDKLLIGGYGDDKLFAGSNTTGQVRLFGDRVIKGSMGFDSNDVAEDGDDILSLGDHPIEDSNA